MLRYSNLISSVRVNCFAKILIDIGKMSGKLPTFPSSLRRQLTHPNRILDVSPSVRFKAQARIASDFGWSYFRYVLTVI